MDENEAARIFGRFHRGQASDAAPGARTGAGLGLAIVRGIAEAHHGTVWVRSSPGSGATFGITLPAPVSPCDPDEQRSEGNFDEQPPPCQDVTASPKDKNP